MLFEPPSQREFLKQQPELRICFRKPNTDAQKGVEEFHAADVHVGSPSDVFHALRLVGTTRGVRVGTEGTEHTQC